MTPAGFPHSDIHGSMLACGSPWLFGAYPVLLRLLAPRHPPYALISLTYFDCPVWPSASLVFFLFAFNVPLSTPQLNQSTASHMSHPDQSTIRLPFTTVYLLIPRYLLSLREAVTRHTFQYDLFFLLWSFQGTFEGYSSYHTRCLSATCILW